MSDLDPSELHEKNLPVWVLVGGAREGANALSARLVESMDQEKINPQKLMIAYGRWVTFTAVLARRLVDEAESAQDLSPSLCEIVDEAPAFNKMMRDFVLSPTHQGLLEVAEEWLSLRHATRRLIQELSA